MVIFWEQGGPGSARRIWGCRGSMATPGPGMAAPAEDDLCRGLVERVTRDPRRGHWHSRPGLELAQNGPQKINIRLTHLHLDHIEGLGFFAPFYDPDCEVSVWGPPSSAVWIS